MRLRQLRSAPDQAKRVRLTLDSRLESVADAGAAVQAFALAAGLGETAASDLELAMVEAANNIILHGFAGAHDKRYTVEIRVSDDEVQVTLRDRGSAIPAAALAARVQPWSLEEEASRGLAIMRACADRFEYRRTGGYNRLVLAKRIPETRRPS